MKYPDVSGLFLEGISGIFPEEGKGQQVGTNRYNLNLSIFYLNYQVSDYSYFTYHLPDTIYTVILGLWILYRSARHNRRPMFDITDQTSHVLILEIPREFQFTSL